MALTKAKVSFLEGLDGAVLTGAMPAVDGSSLTGVAGMTKVTSNPLITTNPSDGVGALWVNKSSGEMFVCKDATTDANVWVNIGGGFGNYGKSFGGNGPGTIAGFTAGGQPASGNVIEKFTFGSANNAVDHGDLSTSARTKNSGCSSATHGYSAGGSVAATDEIIDKFAFSSNVSGTDHGDLMTTSSYRSNNGACSNTHGFLIGGVEGAGSTTIEKFPFASATGSVDSGQDLTISNSQMTCASSTTHGYSVGGYAAGTYTTKIDKWAFATSNNAVDVGDLVVPVSVSGGHSSTTHGYKSGGSNHTLSPANQDHIEKFSFSTDANASNVGDLPTRRRYVTGCHN